MCMGVADNGMIVGHAPIADNVTIHAFAWTRDTLMVDIGTLTDLGHRGYHFSLAYGTNKSGTLIVGWSATGYGTADSLPVVWTPRSVWQRGSWSTVWQIQKLETAGFKGSTKWTAEFATDFGQIIGSANDSNGMPFGVVWNPMPNGDWKISRLPGFSADFPGVAPSDINNLGQIVGDVVAADGSTSFPALWTPKPWGKGYVVTMLPTLAGYQQIYGDGEGINDRGDIVGGSYDVNGNYLVTLWRWKDSQYVPIALPTPSGNFNLYYSWATKINNEGVITGSYAADTVPENTVAWKLYESH